MKSERTSDSTLMKMAPKNDFYDKSRQTYTAKGGWFESVKKVTEKDRDISAKAKA